MNHQLKFFLTLTLTLFTASQTVANEAPPSNRISLSKARTLATQTYAGKVLSEELEYEGGKWIYSFDLKDRKSSTIHEIQVDAVTGKIAGMHLESPDNENKELKDEAKK